jgi:arylsulfatase
VDVIDGYRWELYQVDRDFSEADDVAAKFPDKLKDLQLLFYTEAAKYNVLPLDNSKTSRLDPAIRPSLTRGRNSFTYFEGQTRITEGASPDIKNKSWSITAEMEVKADTTGMIATQGGLFSGWALYLDKGKPVFHSNFCDVAHYEVTGKEALTAGKHTIKLDVGEDTGTPVNLSYDVPFKFTGRIHKVTFDLK